MGGEPPIFAVLNSILILRKSELLGNTEAIAL